jgi:transposase
MQVGQKPKPPSDSNTAQVIPNPELEKRTRRQFSADYKLRIIAEADGNPPFK